MTASADDASKEPSSAAQHGCFKSPAAKKRLGVLQDFLVANFLPIAFLIALVFALAYPVPGRFLVNLKAFGVHIVQEVNIVIVFFISGLALNTQELRRALTRTNVIGIGYGFFVILFLTGCLGFVFREIPLKPREFSIGLTIFCVVPTTLGVGLSLTRSCKGNDAIALLLTVGTNLLGVGTIPIMLKFLFLGYSKAGLNITVDILNLFIRLLITIFVPSILGKALRDLCPPAERFTKEYRTALSLFSTANLAFIVWQTLSGARDRLFEQSAGMVFAVIFLAIGQHLFYLACNYVVVWYGLRMPLKEAIAVFVMASQKAAPVAVTVISYITTDPSVMGLLSIPCIVGQLAQIFIGSAIARYLAEAVDKLYKTGKYAASRSDTISEKGIEIQASSLQSRGDAPFCGAAEDGTACGAQGNGGTRSLAKGAADRGLNGRACHQRDGVMTYVEAGPAACSDGGGDGGGGGGGGGGAGEGGGGGGGGGGD